ncbi:hypothetical protein [Roseomonas indoligenes]|uniref:Uncharacterized protein n=1 Tax=Roseomonas indoligenes TaxID=2820811 RepID=A0A940MW95_9PROT|nr:hypothetical protein [Pararoseomonas indoligenes]MBP0492150.1 hypothetical protein [Pararoseomonas indoligenes]
MAKRTSPTPQWLVANGLKIVVVNGLAVLAPLDQPPPVPSARARLLEDGKTIRTTESGARRILEST